jgi:two-component system, LytTR family, response regulator
MEKLKVFLIDDEPLALKRLSRLLEETGKVEVVGQTSEPLEALKTIPNTDADAIFLDIQMPELTGFELLRKLENYPPVIFTTAYDRFALEAFEVYAIDYLLKPVERVRLAQALKKLEKLSAGNKNEPNADIEKLLAGLAEKPESLRRIASRTGKKVRVIDVGEITHFFAQDKLTFAKNASGGEFPLDLTLSELEEKLPVKNFLRVHRASLVNLDFIGEVHGWFSGRVLIRLKDAEKTEIVVARERVKTLKDALGM